VYPDSEPRVHGLPTLTLVRAPRLERRPEQLFPEASSSFRVVSRKLDQKSGRHDSDGTENGRGSFPDVLGISPTSAADFNRGARAVPETAVSIFDQRAASRPDASPPAWNSFQND
jgi:hypothetical protein